MQVNICSNHETKDIIQKFSDVFDEKVGKINGKYKIILEENNYPVKHCQRSVAVALQMKVKKKLNSLEEKVIIEKISDPTEWISSMAQVTRNGICLENTLFRRFIVWDNLGYLSNWYKAPSYTIKCNNGLLVP